MKTITLEIKESALQELLEFIIQRQDSIFLKQDDKSNIDPYFFERQKKLKQIRNDIKNGDCKLTSFDNFAVHTNKLENHFKEKYAN